MMRMLEQGGVVLDIIFLCSLLSWTLICWKWIELRGQSVAPAWWPGLLERIREGRVQDALALLDGESGLLANVGRSALAAPTGSRSAARQLLSSTIEDEAVDLHKHLPLIAALGAVTPLLGLFGTVVGMIQTFAALARGSGAEASPLASGVSQALLTTQAGLVVALPIVLAFRFLASEVRRHVDEAQLRARHLEAALFCPAGEGD